MPLAVQDRQITCFWLMMLSLGVRASWVDGQMRLAGVENPVSSRCLLSRDPLRLLWGVWKSLGELLPTLVPQPLM